MKKYKYLVVNGCSQTQGQNCNINKIWANLLANKLGLELINLASNGSGWYTLETTTTSFIHNNIEIVDECFFVLQKSMLERELNYNYLPLVISDIWEDYNIKYLPKTSIQIHGYKNWEKFNIVNSELKKSEDIYQRRGVYKEFDNLHEVSKLNFFPEHRHYPNSRHPWKIILDEKEVNPPHIYDQFDELLLHYGQKMLSFHLFLRSLNIDHIMVDGYSPFLSYKLNFKNYYDTNDEYEMVKRFWSNEPTKWDEDDVILYDFKNTKSGWIFDKIDKRYKIDDVILWSLYQFKFKKKWNVDGGHAGPKGMELIKDVIYENLKNKGWFL